MVQLRKSITILLREKMVQMNKTIMSKLKKKEFSI
jgi:hypothetical protein